MKEKSWKLLYTQLHRTSIKHVELVGLYLLGVSITELRDSIDPKHFVSLLYVSVAIKASLLKFSMFSVHKNTISNIFLEFSNF